MKTNYNKTLQACFVGYVVQAIVNNFGSVAVSDISEQLWNIITEDHASGYF